MKYSLSASVANWLDLRFPISRLVDQLISRHPNKATRLANRIVGKTIPTRGRVSLSTLDVRPEDLLGRPPIRLNDAAVGRLICGRVALITGAAGSVGSELVRQLLRQGPRQLILLDQAESNLYDLRYTLGDAPSGTTLITQIADITDERRMRHIFTQYHPEFVFHAAAYKHVPLMEDHPYEAVKVNVLGTKILADLSVKCGVSTFVMISTDKAVNPTNVMGATKRLAELCVQNLVGTPSAADQPVRFITTRFGNVLGSSGSVMPIFMRQIAAGGPVTVTDPKVMRYFMTASEAGQLVLDAAAMGNGGEVFVFDMGQPVLIADLARRLIRLASRLTGQTIALEYIGLRPGEKLYEEPLSTEETTLPTHHPQIKIARLPTLDPSLLQSALHRLKMTLDAGDDAGLVRILKELIPEYVSNNSPYTSLDQPNLAANAR